MLTAETLTKRTPESEAHYNIKPGDLVSFSRKRPVIVFRDKTGHYGTSLEYSPTGGRNWQFVSCHDDVIQAIRAFHNLGLGKDRDPLHYRILKES